MKINKNDLSMLFFKNRKNESLKQKQKLSSYSVVFVCRWRRWRRWIGDRPPGASQVLGAWVVGRHLPPQPWSCRSVSTVKFHSGRLHLTTAAALLRCPTAAMTQTPTSLLRGNPPQHNRCVCVCVCWCLCVLQRSHAEHTTSQKC